MKTPPSPEPEPIDADFVAVALPHIASIARVAFALSGDQSDADDLVQETYLRALKHWRTFKQGTDCKRWLSTICRNAFYEDRGRQRRMEPTESEELDSLAAAQIHQNALTAGVAGMFDQVDLGPAIMTAISKLNPVYGNVVILSDMEGFTYEEIAGMLDIPVGTVRSRLYRARRKLQESLMAYAVDAGLSDPTPSSQTTKE